MFNTSPLMITVAFIFNCVKLMIKTNTTIFIVFALIWEIIVGILFGVFFRYNSTALTTMFTGVGFGYPWSTDPNTTNYVVVNTTQLPYPWIVLVLAIGMLVIGNELLI